MSPISLSRLGYIALFGAVGAYFPYLGVFYASRGLDLGTIGLLTGLAAAAGLVAAPLWGALADRFPSSRVVIPTAALISCVGAVALAASDSVVLMTLSVAVMALAFAGLGPTLDARSLEIVRGDRDRWGGLRAWGSASFIVVVLLTGALIERTSVASLFAVYIGALVSLALIALLLRGHSSASPLPRLHGIGRVLRDPLIARFLAATVLVWSASMAINWYFSIHLLELGAPGELVGSAWAIGALVEVPIMWAFPLLAARIGGERLIIIGAAFFALRALVLLVVTDPVLAAATMALHGMGFGLVLVGSVTFVARHAPPATAATAQGVLSAAIYSLALALGPWAGSTAAAIGGPQSIFVLSLVAGVAAIPAMWLAVRGPSGSRPLRNAAADEISAP